MLGEELHVYCPLLPIEERDGMGWGLVHWLRFQSEGGSDDEDTMRSPDRKLDKMRWLSN